MSEATPAAGLIHPSKEIARGRSIREVERLVRAYGGEAKRWSKRKGPRFGEDHVVYEYH